MTVIPRTITFVLNDTPDGDVMISSKAEPDWNEESDELTPALELAGMICDLIELYSENETNTAINQIQIH